MLLLFGGEGRCASRPWRRDARGGRGYRASFCSSRKPPGASGRAPCEPHCWATLLPPDQFSFPSGHTITAFAVAVSLSMFYPALLVGLLFCAVSVAASRILLGMHFLSDVLAGAAIGTAAGVRRRRGSLNWRCSAGSRQSAPATARRTTRMGGNPCS